MEAPNVAVMERGREIYLTERQGEEEDATSFLSGTESLTRPMSMSARAPGTSSFYAYLHGVSSSFSPLEHPLRIIIFCEPGILASHSFERGVPRAFCAELQ
jgi:hypothetical protein